MSPKAVEQLLGELDPSRRDFLRKVALTTAWAAPFVASFSIDGLGLTGASAGAANLLCSNLTQASNGSTELRIQKEVSAAQIGPGETVTFTITVINCFSQGGVNTVITDALPPQLGFVSINQLSGTAPDSTVVPPVGANGTVTLTWGLFPADEIAVFEIVASAL